MKRLTEALGVLLEWPARRWAVTVGAAIAFAFTIAIPTALIPNPIFGRKIPPTWWSWPALIVSSVLGGLLVATYVRDPANDDDVANRRKGTAGGLLTFFAVGCPVCNKLALLALGYTGALQWFGPIQPYLGAIGVVLLAWALRVRLRGEVACPVPST